MPVVYKRPSSLAAGWSRQIGYFVLVFLITIWVGHRFFGFATSNAVAVSMLALGLALFGFAMALVGFTMLWLIGAKGGRASFVGLTLNLIALAPFGLAFYKYISLPEQYDVVTAQKPQLEWLSAPIRPASWMPTQSSGEIAFDLKNKRIYSELTERRYEGAIDRVYRAVRAVAKDQGYRITHRIGDDFLSPDEPEQNNTSENNANSTGADVPVPARTPSGRQAAGSGAAGSGGLGNEPQFEGSVIRLQMKKNSLILGLHHDVLILLTEDETATFVNMRSATQHGPHDLGLNAELINRFLSNVDNRLLGIVGAG
jgi:hypothetical protein